MRDPDRPLVEGLPADELERLDELAALAAYYHSNLKQWGLSDGLSEDLVVGWQEKHLMEKWES